MKIKKMLGCLGFMMTALPGFSQEQVCRDEYERGKREMGGYAEMLGVIQGVIYAYSLELKSPEVCLPDGAELRVKAIADAMSGASAKASVAMAYVPAPAEAPIAMNYILTRAEAHQFLKRFFPCGSNPLPQSDR